MNKLKFSCGTIICSKRLVCRHYLFQADGFPENNNDGKITREKFNRLCTYNIVDFELVVHDKRKSNVSTTTNIAFSTGFSMANVKFNMQRKMYNQYQYILIYMRSIPKLGLS